MHETSISFFNLEAPAQGAEIPAGRQQLRGWLVPKPGNHFVDVRAETGGREFPGVYGFPRVDLAAHFEPSRPWLAAEFIIEVDFPPGEAEVRIAALDLTGRWQVIHAAHFVIQNTPVSPPATPDPVSAVEFGRAMNLLLVSTAEDKDDHSAAAVAAALPYPRIVRSDHLPFHGYIAEPAGLAPAPYGQMEVVAWLFHESQPIKRAFVSTDLLTFQPLETGGDFAGVAARFPGQPHARNCRWSGVVDVSDRTFAPACVRIFAELADGSVHLCLATLCRPLTTEEIKKTCPPFSLWEFARRWWDLKQAVTRRGVKLETGRAWRTEFWQTFHRSRQLVVPSHSGTHSKATVTLPPAADKKLRLLLITHNLNFEGAPLLFVEYARYLVETGGFEISVLTGQEGPLRQAFEARGASVVLADVPARTPAELSRQIGRLSRQLDWSKIDLVVANTVASFWGVTLAEAAGKPSLLYIHESTSPAAFFRRTTPELLPAVYRAFRQATAVSFNTPATQAYYQALGSGKNFRLNSAWIDLVALDKFRANHERHSLRTTLGLQRGELLVANIGTVCERKGQHDFLRAVEWLWRRAPELAARCRFVMVGGRGTHYNHALKNNLAAIGRPNVQLIPETSRAYDYLGAADLFVCTSYEESFPRVVLEAMALAVPIVSTDVHGIPYMLRHETEAILVAPGDAAALTTGMLRLLENPALGKTLALRAQNRVKEFAATVILPRHGAFAREIAALK